MGIERRRVDGCFIVGDGFSRRNTRIAARGPV